MTTIHVLAPFHTITNAAASHCAFTGKALRFSKMMRARGYRVVEYSNEGSESEADERVVMLDAKEYAGYFKPETSSPGAQANINAPGFPVFRSRLTRALAERAAMGDIVAHVFGPSLYPDLVKRLPGCIHVETGIGYPWTPFGAVPVFESYAWRNYQWGRIGNPGGGLPGDTLTSARSYVVPNYFDVDDWPIGETPENAVGFMGRFVADKGIEMLARIIRAWDRKHHGDGMRFVLAGMGGYQQWLAEARFTPSELARIDYRGVVTGAARAQLLGSLRAFLLPSVFVEPFGGAAVEAMLCGTPAITSDVGAFSETIPAALRCRTVDNYVAAIEDVPRWARDWVRGSAEAKFSLQLVGAQYDAIFRELSTRAAID